jgi:mercuric ion transport protein
MRERALLATGIIGGALAAICCATPLLAVLFGAVGLTAWLAKADYVIIPALIICLGLIGFALYRRRAARERPHGTL